MTKIYGKLVNPDEGRGWSVMATLTQDVSNPQELKMEYPVQSEVSPNKMIPEQTQEEREIDFVQSDVSPQNMKRVQKTEGSSKVENTDPDSTFGNISLMQPQRRQNYEAACDGSRSSHSRVKVSFKRGVQTKSIGEQSGRLGQLKADVNALGLQIESGKSNFPILLFGMGALGLSGLGMLGYDVIKRVVTYFRTQNEKMKKEVRAEIVRQIMGEGYEPDEFSKGAKRFHPRDFTMSSPISYEVVYRDEDC
jgi:hypothetical protein